jgi:RNA polymerase sigma-70 factor (ECF subfamily)
MRRRERSGVQFDDLYYGSYARLFRLTSALCASRAEAEDVLQEAFTRALVRWHSVSRLDDPEGWVRRVAINHAMDQHRGRRRDRGAWRRLGRTETAPGPDVSELPDVIVALRGLPDKQRRVLVLHYLADQSIAQIAATYDLPIGTVKAQLSRGRSALATALRSNGGTDAVIR